MELAIDAPADLVLSLAETPVAVRKLEPYEKPGSVSGKDGQGSWYADLMTGGEDPNPEWNGRGRYPIIREMRLSDPAVRSLEWLMKLPVRSAEWSVVPVSEDPVDLAVADALAWQFGLGQAHVNGKRYFTPRLSQTWDASLNQALLCVTQGAIGEEIIWGDVETWVDADGDEHPIRPIARLAARYPSTVMKHAVDEQTGTVEWIEQDLPSAKQIPAEKLAWYVLDEEPGTIWGTSLLRSAYGPWKLKRGLMIGAAIAFDRFAAGTPVVRYPRSGGDPAKRQAEEIGRNVRVHERGWVALEGPPEEGWDLKIESGAHTTMDPIPLLRHYDAQIAMSGLQQFMSLGSTETGSRAVGEVLADPFFYAVSAIAKEIAAQRMKQVFRRFVDRNFGARVETPELNVAKISGKNVAVIARALADLSSAGLSFTDPDTQNDVRDYLDLRHLPPEASARVQDALDRIPESDTDVGIETVVTPGIDEGSPIT